MVTQPLENNRLDDCLLAEQAAAGNQQAFMTLIERYRRYIYRIAYKISLSEEEALDITQEVYCRLAEKLAQFEPSGDFKRWLGVVACRVAIDYQRKVKRIRSMLVSDQEPTNGHDCVTDAILNPREEYEFKQKLGLIHHAMQQLSPQQRAICLLRFQEDWMTKEIAENLEIPEKQVRVQLHRAVKKMKEIIQRGL